MICPSCGDIDTKVIDSRLTEQNRVIRRRRECVRCSNRFTTYERIENANLIVAKKDGTREPYQREKVEKGFWISLQKRKVSKRQVDEIINKLEEKWRQESEINSKKIGESIMEALKKLDHVAYIRFASVYREFRDIQSFSDELKKLKI